MTAHFLQTFGEAFGASMAQLRERVTDVRYVTWDGHDGITFTLDGRRKYRGELKGRNRELMLTGNAYHDVAIAVRVLLDKHATEIK